MDRSFRDLRGAGSLSADHDIEGKADGAFPLAPAAALAGSARDGHSNGNGHARHLTASRVHAGNGHRVVPSRRVRPGAVGDVQFLVELRPATATSLRPTLPVADSLAIRPRTAERPATGQPAPVVDGTPVVEGTTVLEGTATRIGGTLLLAAVGFAMQMASYVIARNGATPGAPILLYAGLLVTFVPCAQRLLARRSARSVRLRIAAVLGLALSASSFLRQPNLFDNYDELLHQATLQQLIHGHQLFAPNSTLPVSPYYPGLELLTAFIHWVSGLSLLWSEIVVVAASRLVLVVGLFLIVERFSGSARAGGVGVVIYACSPQFYFFNSQYAYQTLALAFAVGAVYLLMVCIDRPVPRMGMSFVLAVANLAALTVTHHLVSWLLVAFLILWTVTLALSGSRDAALLVGKAALAGIVLATEWASFVGHKLAAYLGPIFADAFHQVLSVAAGTTASRQIGHGAGGVVTPAWQTRVMALTVIIWCAVLVWCLWIFAKDRMSRKRRLAALPILFILPYPLLLVARVSADAGQISDRASTFVFIGFAVAAADVIVSRVRRSRLFSACALLAAATLCFLGGMMLGSGPDWQQVPGPYLVTADPRSIDASALAAARWAATQLPAGTSIAADRDNGALMAALADLQPVTALSGRVNVGPLYYSTTFTPYDLTLIHRGHIRLLLVDRRLAEGLPLEGVYFEPGETGASTTPQRLTAAELAKFGHVPGARRIYDNGNIEIYDLSALLHLPPVLSAPGPRYGFTDTGTDSGLLALTALAVLTWLPALRRKLPWSAGALLAGMSASMAAAVLGSFVLVPLAGSGERKVFMSLAAGVAVTGALGAAWRRLRARPGRPIEVAGVPAHDVAADGGTRGAMVPPDGTHSGRPWPFTDAAPSLSAGPRALSLSSVRGAISLTWETGSVVRNFGSLAASQAATAVLGFAYWVLAARLIPADQVGLASAAQSAMSLLQIFAIMGLDTLLISELARRRPDEHRFVLSTALGVSAVAAFVLSLGWALLSPLFGASLKASGGGAPWPTVIFIAATISTVLVTVFDFAVLGLRRSDAQLRQNIIASTIKLALVPVLVLIGSRSGVGLNTVYFLGLAISLVVGFRSLRLQRGPSQGLQLRRRLQTAHQLRSAALRNYILDMVLASAAMLLPVLVAFLLSPRQVAYFSSARLLWVAISGLPYLLVVALFASSANDEIGLRARMRRTLPLGVAITAALYAAFALPANHILPMFGGAYAREGVPVLRILLLAGPAMVVQDHYVTLRRVQNRMGAAAKVILLSLTFQVLCTAAGATLWGLKGLCACWVGAFYVQTALLLPTVLRAAYSERAPRRAGEAGAGVLPGVLGPLLAAGEAWLDRRQRMFAAGALVITLLAVGVDVASAAGINNRPTQLAFIAGSTTEAASATVRVPTRSTAQAAVRAVRAGAVLWARHLVPGESRQDLRLPRRNWEPGTQLQLVIDGRVAREVSL